MPARLVSLDGRPSLVLRHVLAVVGRDRACDLPIPSALISRRHCCLAVDGDGVAVRDLGSTNGTWINGVRVDEGDLRDGDELSLAHLRYRLEMSPGRAASPSPLPGQGDDRGGGDLLETAF